MLPVYVKILCGVSAIVYLQSGPNVCQAIRSVFCAILIELRINIKISREMMSRRPEVMKSTTRTFVEFAAQKR